MKNEKTYRRRTTSVEITILSCTNNSAKVSMKFSLTNVGYTFDSVANTLHFFNCSWRAYSLSSNLYFMCRIIKSTWEGL